MKSAYLRSLKKTVLSAAVIASLGTIAVPETATASTYDFSFSGVFTLLDPTGVALQNPSLPSYYIATWGYGIRTEISGTLHYDTTTNAGVGTIVPFNFFNNATNYPLTPHGLTFQNIGNGTCTNNDPAQGCQPGNLLLGNMLYDWNGNSNIPVSIVWDATGMLNAINGGGLTVGSVITGTGAIPASNGIKKGLLPIGPAPIATTTWNTTLVGAACTGTGGISCYGRNPSGQLPLIADTIGGSPMVAGPFWNYNANFDVISMTVTSVPVPAAVWLFGSGLLGLFGWGRRRST